MAGPQQARRFNYHIFITIYGVGIVARTSFDFTLSTPLEVTAVVT